MKKLALLTIILLLSNLSIRSQTLILYFEEDNRNTELEYSLEDIDGDSALDSLYYEFETDSIVFLLSSKNFQPFKLYYGEGHLLGSAIYRHLYLTAIKGGFEIGLYPTKSVSSMRYMYEAQSNKFRLAYAIKDTNRGYEGYEVDIYDLKKQTYQANIMFYHGYETDSLETFASNIEIELNYQPTYWEDGWNFPISASELIEKSKTSYQAERTDTIQFLDFREEDDILSIRGIYDGETTSYETILKNYPPRFYELIVSEHYPRNNKVPLENKYLIYEVKKVNNNDLMNYTELPKIGDKLILHRSNFLFLNSQNKNVVHLKNLVYRIEQLE